MVKIGDKFRIINENGQYTKWANRTWTIDHIARSTEEHPGYDEGLRGQALVSAKGLPVSLYEYEIDIIPKKPRRRGGLGGGLSLGSGLMRGLR